MIIMMAIPIILTVVPVMLYQVIFYNVIFSAVPAV